MATNREVARDALVTLLTASLVGIGLPCKLVAGSKQNTLEGLTPMVIVHSAGTTREGMTFQGNRAIFDFVIQVWVQQTETGWTAAQAIDALDLIESLIAATFETNRTTADWELLQYTAATEVSEIAVAGVPFYLEEYPVRVYLAKS